MVLVYKDFTFEIEIEGRVDLGTPEVFSGFAGNWLPGDKAEAKDVRVYIRHLDDHHNRTDITKVFSEQELKEFELKLIDARRNE